MDGSDLVDAIPETGLGYSTLRGISPPSRDALTVRKLNPERDDTSSRDARRINLAYKLKPPGQCPVHASRRYGVPYRVVKDYRDMHPFG